MLVLCTHCPLWLRAGARNSWFTKVLLGVVASIIIDFLFIRIEFHNNWSTIGGQ